MMHQNLRCIIGALEGMQDSEMKQGMKDLIATGGIPMTEMGKSNPRWKTGRVMQE